jgi:hypothetical protein
MIVVISGLGFGSPDSPDDGGHRLVISPGETSCSTLHGKDSFSPPRPRIRIPGWGKISDFQGDFRENHFLPSMKRMGRAFMSTSQNRW